MNIGSIAASTPGISTAVQARPPVDTDGDNDNDATESAAAKQAEAAPSLPVDPNRGRNLNISA